MNLPNRNELEDFIQASCEYKNAKDPEVRLDCPRCTLDDKNKYKLYFNLDNCLFHCKICHYGEDSHNFVEMLSEVSGEPISNLSYLFGTQVPSDNVKFIEILEKLLGPAIKIKEEDKKTKPYFIEDIQEVVNNSLVLEYLTNRGISEDKFERYRIKSCNKVYGSVDNYAAFLMEDLYGNAAFQTRRLSSKQPKYLSSPNCNGSSLYPFNEANLAKALELKKIVVVEGVFDSIACIENTYPSLASFGNGLTDLQFRYIRRSLPRDVEVIFGYDSDYATRKVVIQLVKKFSHYYDKISVIDTSKGHTNKKLDFGDVLADKTLLPWFEDRMNNRVEVGSTNYFNWLLETKLMRI